MFSGVRNSACGGDGGCSACGRVTFPRRKVTKVRRACGPGPGGSHPEGKHGLGLVGAGADLWSCSFPRPLPLCGGCRGAFCFPCLGARLVWQQSRGAVFSGAHSGSARRGRCPHRPVSVVRRLSRDAEDSVPYKRTSSIYRKGSRRFNPPHPARFAVHLPPREGYFTAAPRDCCPIQARF